MKEELSNSIKKKILRQSERTAESPDTEEKPNFLKIINLIPHNHFNIYNLIYLPPLNYLIGTI